MSTHYEFTIPGKPTPYTRMVRGDQSPRAQRYRAYREDVAWRAKAAGANCWPKTVPVSVNVWIGIPNRMQRRWDADNVLKGITDALIGVCFTDDKQIVSARVAVYNTSEEPAVYVSIARDPWP